MRCKEKQNDYKEMQNDYKKFKEMKKYKEMQIGSKLPQNRP